MSSIDPCDLMRPLEQIGAADPRMAFFSLHTHDGCRPLNQEDRWQAIAALSLISEVPESIRVHYDTGRNLYLYAWHVYRFHVVAEQHALTTLELALRLRLTALRLGPSAKRKPGLKELLVLALRTFEIVSALINQIHSDPGATTEALI